MATLETLYHRYSGGLYEEALACWRQSFAQDGTLCDNLYSIAFLLGRLGRYEEAIGAWEDVRQSLRRLGCDIEEGMVDKEIEKLKRKIPPAAAATLPNDYPPK